tara:strand:- start:15191 stop:15493 length:303 start_codon:yes stop_codon:yes gene_type:complete
MALDQPERIKQLTDTILSLMTPAQRFEHLDRIATEFFGTNRWKTKFSNRYGLSAQAINAWRGNGAPVWAVQAIMDAVSAENARVLIASIEATKRLLSITP